MLKQPQSVGIGCFTNYNPFETWDGVRLLKTWERTEYHKIMAMRIFFRSMASICGLTVVLTVLVNLPCVDMPINFKDKSCIYGLFGFGLGMLFVFCWQLQNGTVLSWQKHIKSLQKTGRA